MSNQSYIYFLRQIGGVGPIKIGCSKRPIARLEDLAGWSPIDLELILTIPGDFDLERKIHDSFGDLHLRREWFQAAPRLLEAVDRMKAGESVTKVIDLTARHYTMSKKALHWSRHPENRLRASYSHRLGWAERKARAASATHWYMLPDDVEDILIRWRGYGHDYAGPVIQPSKAEIDRLEEVLANPLSHLVAQPRRRAA